MFRWFSIAIVASMGVIAACTARPIGDARPDAAPLPNTLAPVAPSPAPDAQRVALGKALFFDSRLSGDGTMSCATCHEPNKGFGDGLAFGKGHAGKVLGRNTPTILNVETRAPLFWDGRAATLEEQALGPIGNPDEMAKEINLLIAELKAVPEYVARFKRAFPDGEISRDNIGRALADFERTIGSKNSPFDRYLRGDTTAMSAEAIAGYRLFTGRARCVKCHDGAQLTDNGFHNIGIAGGDEGRFKIVPVAVLRGAFKTPGLRDVELTAPYFHNGSAKSLEEVVLHYDKGGVDKANLDPDVTPLGMTAEERVSLVAFMRALSGEIAPVTPPRVPRLVTKPTASSTFKLMTQVDGMLDRLDRLIGSVDSERWQEVAASVEQLTANAEELAALRAKIVKPARLSELNERIGDLLVDFRGLADAAERRDRAAAMTTYASVRDHCESCHHAFRPERRR
jgi:cytochrome c peroxidase